MPTNKAAMYAALSGDPAVKAVVGAKVYPDQAAADADEPFLVFQEVTSHRPTTLSGKAGIRFSRFQVTGYCATRVQAEALAKALEALLDGKARRMIGGLLVLSSRFADDEGTVDEDEAPDAGEEFGDRVVRADVLWAV